MTTMTTGADEGTRTLLDVHEVTKTFPGLRALDHVSLRVRAGEVVALLGQNGSGKSTLVKILAGVYKADAGEVHTASSDSDRGALHFIHQDLGLVEGLSTVENLGLERHSGWLRPLRRRREADLARSLIAGFGVEFDVLAPIRALTPPQRTIVAIARAMDGWETAGNVLVLDEPTASLQREEVGILFTAVRRVAEQGAGVLFISHRLEEVTALADRVVVLRDGKVVADRDAAGLTPSSLAELITGSVVTQGVAAVAAEARATAAALSVRGLSGGSIGQLDLDLWPGEVVGIAGSLGSGREDVCSLVYGARRCVSGSVAVNGDTSDRHSPRDSIGRAVAFVPSDRRAHAAVMSISLRENLTLPDMRALTRGRIHLQTRRERFETDTWMRTLNIQPRMPERPLGLFSGGNQQKAVIAKWLRVTPSVLLVDEPTQGVDVGSSESIRALLVAAAADGMSVLICSSDNADLVRMCSRVLVMRDGVVACELRGTDIADHRITQECLGSSVSERRADAHSPSEATYV
jgi:ABC-type sugar transport system ATPase subunit